MIATVISAFLLFTHTVHADAGKSRTQVEFANSTFQNVLLKCPERIWPGLEWTQTGILLISYLDKSAWMIGTENIVATRINFALVPDEAGSVSDFKILELHGKTILAINLDGYAGDADTIPLGVAVHELFHRLGQIGWEMPSRPRGDIYPLLSGPRYARAMLLSALQSFANGGANDLSAASFWLEKWQAAAPEEVLLSTDRREGTARYVEQTAIALGKIGCAADQKRLFEVTGEWIDHQSLAKMPGLDGEGYTLGAVAAFLLDRRSDDWKAKVPAGKSPLELLLDGQKAERARENAELRDSISVQVEAANSDIMQWIAPFSSQLESQKYWRVIIPDSWANKTSGFEGFFIPRSAASLTYAIFAAGTEYAAPSSSTQWMILTDHTLGLQAPGEAQPCANKGTEFLISKSAVKSKRGHYSAHAQNIDFEFSAMSITRGHFNFLCPTAN